VQLRDYLTRYASRRLDLSESTIALYGYSIGALERFCGRPVRLPDLSDDLLCRFLRSRLKKAAPKTVKRERGDILCLWRAAARNGLCDPPDGDVPVVPVPRKTPVAWWPDEVRALIDTSRELTGEMRGLGIRRADWWASLFFFLFDSLSRIGAAMQVAPVDVDLSRGLAVLRMETAKTNVEQVVRLHDRTVAAIRKIWGDDRLVVWPYPYHRRQIWPQLKSILKRAGLPQDRDHMFHCCRRTTATVAACTMGRAAASAMLGHATGECLPLYIDTRQIPPTVAPDVVPIAEPALRVVG